MARYAVTRRCSHEWVALVLAMVIVSAGCSRQAPPDGQSAADQRPAAATPATSSQPSGGAEGFLERMSCDEVRGWAWDPSQPDYALTIELYDGDRLVSTTVANRLRQDLVDARKGNGRHMFSEVPPLSVRDGKPHAIRAVVKGTGVMLRPLADTPSSMTCPR